MVLCNGLSTRLDTKHHSYYYKDMKMGPGALEETSATPIAHEKRAPVLDGIIKRPVGMKRLGESIKR